MTGEEFVKLCYAEKEEILNEYFKHNSELLAAKKIQNLIQSGTNKDALFELIHLVMTETYYTLLLALDGEASLGGEQIAYKLYDEDGNLLNECGEIEAAAYCYFMENCP